jgi:hypothetical protein
MANRIIRDWTDSEKIDSLSNMGEIFFIRLCMKADDFGCYHANPKLLKAALFPLKEDVLVKDVKVLFEECLRAELFKIYEHSGKQYLEIINFGQGALRRPKRKFPTPDGQVTDNRRQTTAEIETNPKGNESQSMKGQSVIEFYFTDFPNSIHLENIVRAINVPKETLIEAIPKFREAASLSYPNTLKFAEHFKNWYLKKGSDKAKSNSKHGDFIKATLKNNEILKNKYKDE